MINSRQKGKAFELKICKKLEELTGKKFTPTPGSGAYSTRTGDMRFAGDVMGETFTFPFVIECKKYKEANIEELLLQKGNMWKWLQQLIREKKHRPGILIFSKNYGKIIVVVETNKEIANTFRYGKWIIGLFDKVMPEIL